MNAYETARAAKMQYSAAPATTPQQQRGMNSVTPTRNYWGRPVDHPAGTIDYKVRAPRKSSNKYNYSNH